MAIPAGMLAGCGPDDAEDLLQKGRERGYVTVAIANDPPFTEVAPDGRVTGCAPEVFRVVCRRLGIADIQGTVVPYDGMVSGLNAGRWDAIAAGLFMSESRCREIAYSEPAIVATESFGVSVGNPKNIRSIQDVVDHPAVRVVVLPRAFEAGLLQAADVPEQQIVPISDTRSGLDAVLSGRADAFLLPTPSLEYLARSEVFEVTGPIEDVPTTGSGAGFRKSDGAFRKAYDAALKDVKETDEFAAILGEWGFDPALLEGVTTDELCQSRG